LARDDVTQNGSLHGGRRRARRRRAAGGDDDRPRGFEPDRMRRLWSDIDQARDNLGLGSAPADASTWSVLGLVGSAAGLASDAAGRLTSGAVGAVRGVVGVFPDPLRLLGATASCVRRLPLVGGFFGE
jgi:hypothetical protein